VKTEKASVWDNKRCPTEENDGANGQLHVENRKQLITARLGGPTEAKREPPSL
jgi:hypothetical protein